MGYNENDDYDDNNNNNTRKTTKRNANITFSYYIHRQFGLDRYAKCVLKKGK
jgi:hypothetical protein